MIEEALQMVNVTKVASAIGLNTEQFTLFIIGSIIVGLSGLTFYYYVYKNDTRKWWDQLRYLEKSIISFVVGAICIVNAFLIIGIIDVISNKFDILLKPLIYIGPFFYFIFFAMIRRKKASVFVKEFIRWNTRMLGILVIILLLVFIIKLRQYRNFFEITIIFITFSIILPMRNYKFKKRFKSIAFILFMIPLVSFLIISIRIKSYSIILLRLMAVYTVLKSLKTNKNKFKKKR